MTGPATRWGLILWLAWTGACRESAPPAPDSPAAAGLDRVSHQAPENPLQGMVRIPAGPFWFGATELQFQYYVRLSTFRFPGMEQSLRKLFVIPPRSLTLPEFYLDQFEVTNQQYLEFVRATGYRPADRSNYLQHWEGETRFPDWAATFPVVWVNRADAEAYCRWRSARLPREEEWEKAARGEDQRYFPWGDVRPDEETANHAGTRAEPVGNRPGDRSPYGVYDLGGNVAEWTSGNAQMEGTLMAVVKGGSFSGQAREMLVYSRELLPPTFRSQAIGFRCARDP